MLSKKLWICNLNFFSNLSFILNLYYPFILYHFLFLIIFYIYLIGCYYKKLLSLHLLFYLI